MGSKVPSKKVSSCSALTKVKAVELQKCAYDQQIKSPLKPSSKPEQPYYCCKVSIRIERLSRHMQNRVFVVGLQPSDTTHLKFNQIFTNPIDIRSKVPANERPLREEKKSSSAGGLR